MTQSRFYTNNIGCRIDYKNSVVSVECNTALRCAIRVSI